MFELIEHEVRFIICRIIYIIIIFKYIYNIIIFKYILYNNLKNNDYVLCMVTEKNAGGDESVNKFVGRGAMSVHIFFIVIFSNFDFPVGMGQVRIIIFTWVGGTTRILGQYFTWFSHTLKN